MNFTAARRVREVPGTWLLESEEFVACVSRHQISSLVPKRPPYLTGGYWDDIGAAARTCRAGGDLLVLGAGIGSFVPALRRLQFPGRTVAVEHIEEYARLTQSLGRRFSLEQLRVEHADVTRFLNTEAGRFSAIFVDLYDPEGISHLAVNSTLYRALLPLLEQDALVFVNIFDATFESPDQSPTVHARWVLQGLFPAAVGIRRPNSITLALSAGLNEDDIVARLQCACGQAGTAGDIAIVRGSEFAQQPRYFDSSLLLFDAQTRGRRVTLGSGLVDRALDQVRHLDAARMIALSRRTPQDQWLGAVV